MIPSHNDGPADQVERRDRVARSREALQALKPNQLRALTLLAEGYSYAEIGELTSWSYTKINRLIAEGRLKFRGVLLSSEDGSRCRELAPALSAFCDGEATESDEDMLREHLRACPHCRHSLSAFRAAPRRSRGACPRSAAVALPARSCPRDICRAPKPVAWTHGLGRVGALTDRRHRRQPWSRCHGAGEGPRRMCRYRGRRGGIHRRRRPPHPDRPLRRPPAASARETPGR